MSDFEGRLRDLTRNMDGTWNVTVTVKQDPRSMADELRDKDIDVTIKRHRARRSLDANAYAWVLIGKIAEVMRISKTEVYQAAIRDIGGVSDIVCVQEKAAEALRKGWEQHGIGWMTAALPSRIAGCVNVVLYYGSSTYDTRQMSLLIDHLVEDARNLGIETMSPRELEALLGQYSAKR